MAHVLLLKSAPEPIVDHGIDELTVPEAVAVAGTWEQVGCSTHVFHTTSNDHLGIAALDQAGCQHYRLQTTSTDLIDGESTDAGWQTSSKGRLTRRILAQSGSNHIAHDALVQPIWLNPCTFDCSTNSNRPEIGRTECCVGSVKLSYGRACCTNDHDIVHEHLLG